MELSWQQGPLAPGAIGRFLLPEPLPKRLLYAEPLRRRMRVRFGGTWIAESERVVLLFEPGHYPMAYFPETDISPGTVEHIEHTTRHQDLGLTAWYSVKAGGRQTARGAWQHVDLPSYASDLEGRIAFAWPAMEAFYEEDERILGHAADSYHRIDIRQSSRNLIVRHSDRVIANTKQPMVLYESGFAPRWYVPRADIDESALTSVKQQTYCPYKGLCSYYDIRDARLGAWSYPEAHRVVQLTPPGSGCSVQIGKGLTDAPAGSVRNMYLVVTDLEAARKSLLERGVYVSEIRHKTPVGAWDGGFASGLDPARGNYASFATFCDPDGNGWVLQERGYSNV